MRARTHALNFRNVNVACRNLTSVVPLNCFSTGLTPPLLSLSSPSLNFQPLFIESETTKRYRPRVVTLEHDLSCLVRSIKNSMQKRRCVSRVHQKVQAGFILKTTCLASHCCTISSSNCLIRTKIDTQRILKNPPTLRELCGLIVLNIWYICIVRARTRERRVITHTSM